MRTLLSSLIAILTAAIVVGLSIFVVQNSQSEQFSYLGGSLHADKGVIVAGAAVLGFLLAFLLLIPGRLASAWRGWSVGRQAQALEQRLSALREEYAGLQGSHRLLLKEHDRVMGQMLTPAAAAAAAERERAPLALRSEPSGNVASPTKPVAVAEAPRPTGPLYPPPPAPPPWRRVRGGAPAPGTKPGPTLVERLRARFAALTAKVQDQVRKLRRPKQKPSKPPTQQEPPQQAFPQA